MPKVNVVMSATDEFANIDVISANLKAHFLLCVGSAERILMFHTEKGEGDHASSMGLHLFEVG